MTWIPTYGRVSLVCDDCTAPHPVSQREADLVGDESHHEGASRLWNEVVGEGWRSRANGRRHSCTECSGAEPW